MPGPIATVGSMHVCPMCTGTVPHVGGPITQGESNILINGKPAATQGSICTCVGPPDMVVQGAPAVFFNGKPVACVGDMTAHGGTITVGEQNVIISTATPTPSVTMPVCKIPFSKISLINKITGNAKEAIANQEKLKEAEEKDILVKDLQWRKDNKQVSETYLGTVVEIYASVSGSDAKDGMYIPFRIYEKDEKGEDDFVNSVMGQIENGIIQILWETIYTEDNDGIESVEELQEKQYTLPEYVIKYDNVNGEILESNVLTIKDCLKLQVIDEETGEPLSEANFTIILPNGEMIEGQLDVNGEAIVEEVSVSQKHQIVFHKDEQVLSVAKY